MPPPPQHPSNSSLSNPSDWRLLISLAHPDDESFGSPPVGTIARYAKSKVGVHLICATRGEAGTVAEKHLSGFSSVGELRSRELACAAQALGVSEVHFLDYRDSGMEGSPDNRHPDCLIQAPVEAVAEKITRLIRRIRPQVVVTFDETGGYFHPDHIHVHQATTLAFHAAGDATRFPHQIEAGLRPHQPQKLYYTIFPRTLVKLAVHLLPLIGQDPAAFGQNRDINLRRIAAVEQVVTTRLNVAAYFKQSQLAAACHASQAAGLPPIPGFILKWFSRFEAYTRAIPPPDDSEDMEDDLFAGIA